MILLLVPQSAQKIAGKVRKMDSKEIQAQKNVNKQNELYREAMSEHDKTKTQKEELERQYNVFVFPLSPYITSTDAVIMLVL